MTGEIYQVWRIDCESCGDVEYLGEDYPGDDWECSHCGELINEEEE